MRRPILILLACLVVAGTVVAVAVAASGRSDPSARSAPPTPIQTASPTATEPDPLSPSPRSEPRVPTGPLRLAGCPPPARPPGPPGPPPWHPATLVPDSRLPAPAEVSPWTSDLGAVHGKGMWVWQWDQTDGGSAEAVVRRAVDAGLRQLWVRVGSSRDGYYGDPILDDLVAPAHAAGISVIGWGFPYLYDPIRDADWTKRALSWRGPNGEQLDGFSADIEKPSEGVMLSKRRVAVYLAAVRKAAGSRLLVATVYRPSDLNWINSTYPYRTMARYVDAFAPMVYWGCNDPRELAEESLRRLSRFRPVHLIGQAYDMGPEGGRTEPPSPKEITAFLAVGVRDGALGASFWSWQHATQAEWNAVARYPWPAS